MATTTNGAAEKPRNLKQLREERALVECQIELRRLEQSQRLLEQTSTDWWGDWKTDAHLIDRVRQLDGQRYLAPGTTRRDRKHGQNWPIWNTEQELDQFRQQSRILCTVNSYARGLLKNLTNYTIRNGYGYHVVSKELSADADPRKAGRQEDPKLKRLVARVQDWLDAWQKRVRWGQRQREIYRRVLRDGEAFVRLFGDKVRFVEPEQVTDPPGAQTEDGWSFGIQHEIDEEGHEDVETILYYHCLYGEALEGDYVSADEIVHVLPPDHDSTVKRGTPAFLFDTTDALIRASKLQRNISVGNAIQAATAEYWQMDGSSAASVTSMVAGLRETTVTDPRTGRTESIERIEPGTIRRGPAGQEIVPLPKGVGTGEMIQAVQGDLRQAASGFAAPEYLASGDASNANFASTKEAGAPFTVSAETDQDHYREAFLQIIHRCMQYAIDEGELPREALTLVEIQAEPPAMVTVDPFVTAQADQIAVQTGWKSNRTCAMERRLDWESEEIANEEWQERHGQPAAKPEEGPPQPEQPGQGGPQGPGGSEPFGSPQPTAPPGAGPQMESRILEAALRILETTRGVQECGGKGGKPGPCPEPGGDAPAPQKSGGLPVDDALAQAKVEPLKVAGAVHGAGGINKVTVGDKSYFHKQASGIEAQREEATAELAAIAGVGVPQARQAAVGGKDGVLSDFVDGTAGDKDKTGFYAAVKADPVGATRHALFNFLAGAEDRHAGNYIVGKDGLIYSLDHSDTLAGKSPQDAAELMGQDDILAALEKAQGGGDIRFDPAATREMASQVDAMAAHLRKKGMDAAAQSLETRGKVLQALAQEKEPSESKLKSLSGLRELRDELTECASCEEECPYGQPFLECGGEGSGKPGPCPTGQKSRKGAQKRAAKAERKAKIEGLRANIEKVSGHAAAAFDKAPEPVKVAVAHVTQALTQIFGRVQEKLGDEAASLAQMSTTEWIYEITKGGGEILTPGDFLESGGKQLVAHYAAKALLKLKGKRKESRRFRHRKPRLLECGGEGSGKPGPCPDPSKKDKPSEKRPAKAWDGTIDQDEVEAARGWYERGVATWNFYDDDGTLWEQDIRLQQGTYDPDPDNPDSEQVNVYRFVSTQEGDPIEKGEWVATEEEAREQGEAYAAENNQEPPEEPEDSDDEIEPTKHDFHTMDDRDMLSLVGMPDGAEVESQDVKDDGVSVKFSHPQLEDCERFFGVDEDGNKFIKNELLVIKDEYAGKGLGAEIFSKQVAAAAQQGFAYIQTYAAGSKDADMNGYYTWPRFGYDQSVKNFRNEYPTLLAQIKAEFPDAESVLDIMSTKHGRDWWKENGRGLYRARFDLSEGSRSRKVLEAYLQERARAKG